MNLRNMIRWNALVLGTAALLFCTATVHAQEIVNTAWNDGPATVASPQSGAAPAANPANPTATEPVSMSPGTAVAKPVATREAAVTQWAAVEIWMLGALLTCTAIVALYALFEARRANRNFKARMTSMNPRTTLS